MVDYRLDELVERYNEFPAGRGHKIGIKYVKVIRPKWKRRSNLKRFYVMRIRSNPGDIVFTSLLDDGRLTIFPERRSLSRGEERTLVGSLLAHYLVNVHYTSGKFDRDFPTFDPRHRLVLDKELWYYFETKYREYYAFLLRGGREGILRKRKYKRRSTGSQTLSKDVNSV